MTIVSKTVEIGLTSAVISSVISIILTHFLMLKKLNKEVYFKKKFEYFWEIAKELERECKRYHILSRESKGIINTKNFKKLLKRLESIRKEDEFKLKLYLLNIFKNNKIYEKLREFIGIQQEFYEHLQKLSKEKEIPNELQRINGKLINKQLELIDEIKKELKP